MQSGCFFCWTGFNPIPEWSTDFALFDSSSKLSCVCCHAADEPFGEDPGLSEGTEPSKPELLLVLYSLLHESGEASSWKAQSFPSCPALFRNLNNQDSRKAWAVRPLGCEFHGKIEHEIECQSFSKAIQYIIGHGFLDESSLVNCLCLNKLHHRSIRRATFLFVYLLVL